MHQQSAIIVMLLATTFILGTTADEYHCGMGGFTKALSRTSAYFCDSHLLTTECCLPHDNCYEEVGKYWSTATYVSCDIKFKHCINTIYRKRPFCRRWLVATHYSPLTVSSFFRQNF